MIRPYRKGDLDAVVDLVKAVLTEYGFAANVGGAARDLAQIDATYSGARAGFWVAERDGVLVGTIGVRTKDERTAELKRLYVAGAARGQGVGRALYEHAESFVRTAGYERIWLDSSRRFVEARRLYERNGFVLVEEIDNDWCDNVYEKLLR